MDTTRTYLDGNAAAGPLAEVLTFDITTVTARCAGCRGDLVMARCWVYAAGPGLVLRCPSCHAVLLRLVAARGRAWLDMTGLACLRIPSADPP